MIPLGLHIVRKLRKGKPAIWYVYAYRGGPCVHRCEGARPKITAEIAAEAVAKRQVAQREAGNLSSLIADFRSPTTPEWARLAESTRSTWRLWLDRIDEKFGDAPIEVLNDRKMRGDILRWRDGWINQPRSADQAIEAFRRLLSWGMDRGILTNHILLGVASLYEADRSDIIWEPRHFEAFAAVASVEVWEGVELASLTGLRRGDLVAVPWAAVGDHAIIWQTSKSRGRNRAVVPLLPETRALLRRIKDRHEREQAAKPPSRRKPLPETILSNSRWEPWTPSGFGSRFNDAKHASGIDVHLHDVRGTFATRCMIAGLTDQEIADILGWGTKDVAAIRIKYVDQARVVVAMAERISRGKT